MPNFTDCPKHLLYIAEFGRLAKTNIRWPLIWMRHILSSLSSKTGENHAYFVFKQSQFEQTLVDFVFSPIFCLKMDKMSSSKETGKTHNQPQLTQMDSVWRIRTFYFLKFLKRKRIGYVSSTYEAICDWFWPICKI